MRKANGKPHVFDLSATKDKAYSVEQLIASFTQMAMGLAKSVMDNGLLLTIMQRRDPESGDLQTFVDVKRYSNLAGEDDGSELPLALTINGERDTQRVTLEFNQPIALMTLTGDQAIELAQQLVNHAKVAGTTKQVDFIL